MSTRPINIPRASSSSRSPSSPNRAAIESIISIPITSGSSSSNSSLRPTSRSFTIPAAAMPIRNSPRSRNSISSRERLTSAVPFEPRVVRASEATMSGRDPTCPPASATHEPGTPSTSLPSTSTSAFPSPRTRRPSMATTTTAGSPRRAASVQRRTSTPAVVHHSSSTPSSQPTSFVRPGYLEHSAMRNMLITDVSEPSLPRSRSSSVSRMSVLSSSSEDDDYGTIPPPPPAPAATLSSESFTSPSVIRLPTRWSEQVRNTSLSVSADGREVTYNGSGASSERDAAAIRANFPIPPACGMYYFEVSVIRARGGSSSGSKARISVGFSASNVSLNRLPGWDPRSWGYHGDDGCSYASQDTGTTYGQPFGANDTVGCGIDFSTNRAFFTKNGQFLGYAFSGLPAIQLFPSVGLKHSNDAVKVNFGQEKFQFDIEWCAQQAREKVWSSVIETPIRLSRDGSKKEKEQLGDSETKALLNKLVLEYLDHHGYMKSAQAFSEKTRADVAGNGKAKAKEETSMDVDSDIPGSALSPSSSIAQRTDIVNAVAKGDIDAALEGLRKHFPSVLDTVKEDEYGGFNVLLLKLRCRKFVELILETVRIRRKLDAAEAQTDAEMSMDIDSDATATGITNGFTSSSTGGKTSAAKLHAQYDSLLQQALAYGRSLQNEYKTDNEEVNEICNRTFGIVAYTDPAKAGGVEAEVVGEAARKELAEEVRRAILVSQGRPTRAMLEMIYRYTTVSLLELGVLGNGSAAFVDVEREILKPSTTVE